DTLLDYAIHQLLRTEAVDTHTILSGMMFGVVREECRSAWEIGRSCLDKVLDFAGKRVVGPRFLAFWDFASNES
ncbi:MAG: hypothetical protein ACRD9W_09150, partial [Terriglobia bacterium]